MFETYTDIFNQRGQLYHNAMLKYPLARQSEFAIALAHLDLQPHLTVCDVPAGGGYLSQFIDVPNIKLFSIETSSEFVRKVSSAATNNTSILCETITKIPLLDASIDRVISLAGLHHVPTPTDFFHETYRLLHPNGIFVLADVEAGTGVDRFLNGFVDQHNSMGHRGEFLTQHTRYQLQDAGFEVLSAQPRQYTWQFATPDDMAGYCKMLFGLDKATLAQVRQGIDDCLGYQVDETGCRMNWELLFLKARKLA